jgi:hypothetical protein
MRGSNQPFRSTGRGRADVQFGSTSLSNPSIAFLVEHLAVRVFEHVLFDPGRPAVRQVKPVQVLDDFRLAQQAPDGQFLSNTGSMSSAAHQCRRYAWQ